jgi:hypothetical protein
MKGFLLSSFPDPIEKVWAVIGPTCPGSNASFGKKAKVPESKKKLKKRLPKQTSFYL